MRKLKEVLRLLSLGLKQHQIAHSCSIAQSTVSEYVKAAEAAGLGWPAVAEWDDRRIEETLFPNRPESPDRRQYPPPDFSAIHHELQTHKHVTLQLLWEEYRQACPNGYRYSRFCDLYRGWLRQRDVVLRQQHRAGEKTFVDWAGDTVPVYHGQSGGVHQASIFVAVLGASSYTFAEAAWTQTLPDWIGAHIRAFEFFGGVSEIVVPDFVPGNKFRLLCRAALCGGDRQGRCKMGASGDNREHNRLALSHHDFRSGFPNGGCHARTLLRQASNGRSHPCKLVGSRDRTLRRMDGIARLCHPECL
jgi:transposase